MLHPWLGEVWQGMAALARGTGLASADGALAVVEEIVTREDYVSTVPDL